MRGLSFRLLKIPFRAELWFFIILVLWNIERLQPLKDRPIFTIAHFVEGMAAFAVAIIVHELGHCFVLRRYDQDPSVVLWGLGGLTFGSAPLPPKRSILVSAAGPVAGLLLIGLPAHLALQAWYATYLPFAELGSLPYLALVDLRFLAILWSLVNLLPIIPLDGGHICEAVLELWHGEPRKQTARMVSVVTGFTVGTYTFFWLGWTFGLFIGYLLAIYNLVAYVQERNNSPVRFEIVPEGGAEGGAPASPVVSLERERKRRDRRSSAELLRDGYAALERREYKAVLRTANRLTSKRLSGETATRAQELAAWGWLGEGDLVQVEAVLGAMPKGASPSRPLAAVIELVNHRTDAAVASMLQIMVRDPDDIAKVIAVDFFAEHGMTHRLARELVDLEGGKGFEAAVALEGMLHRLHRTQDASTVSDVILLG